jgi:hypothetical protein
VSQQSPQQPQQHEQNQPTRSTTQSTDSVHTVSSAPVTPIMALTDESSAPSGSASGPTPSERQSALLSLLGGPAPSNRQAVQNVPLPTQVPTPPGSSQRSNASPGHNENQGKILLEQLMAGYVRLHLLYPPIVACLMLHLMPPTPFMPFPF